MTPISRRRLLASAGIGAAGIGIGGVGYVVGQDSAEASDEGSGSVPFYGEHQAGIETPAQDRLHFASFDLLTENRAELREMLREWSVAAAEMSAGQRRLRGPSRDFAGRLRRRDAALLSYSDSFCRFLLGCPNSRPNPPRQGALHR